MRLDPSIFTIREQSPRQCRVGGALILVGGLFVAAFGTIFLWLMMGNRIPLEWLPAGSRYDDTPGAGQTPFERIASFALITWILVSGVTMIALGSWQLATGRSQHILRQTLIYLTIFFFIVGAMARAWQWSGL